MIRENVPKESGIYQIRNLTSGKLYIGGAKNLRKRSNEHASTLKNNKHANKHLQAAYDESGASNFMFTPLLICAAKDVRFYEQRALDTFKGKYNISPSATNNSGVEYSEEMRDRARAAKPCNKYMYKGAEYSLHQLSKISVAGSGTIKRRIHVYGWSVDKAVEVPAGDPVMRKETSTARERATKYRYNGEDHTLPEISEFSGVDVSSLKHRMKSRGMSAQQAAESTKRLARRDEYRPTYDYRGKSLNIDELCALSDHSIHAVKRRIQLGWTIEDAVEKPLRMWK